MKPRNEQERCLIEYLEARKDLAIIDQVLRLGKWWSPAPRPKAVRRRSAKQCFANSQRLAGDKGWSYVEGYALDAGTGLPFHHGWCGDEEGRAIDATWEEPGVAYFGVAFSPDEVDRWIQKNGVLGAILISGTVPELPEGSVDKKAGPVATKKHGKPAGTAGQRLARKGTGNTP
jgi:hypothetical protein